jgi:group I intron endonuclease
MKPYGIIYKLTSPSGKCYIGQTTKNSIDGRYGTTGKLASGQKLINAILKYGYNNFKKEILCKVYCKNGINILEQFYINKYNSIKSGYNCKFGGSSGKHTDDTKKKLSLLKMGSTPWNKGIQNWLNQLKNNITREQIYQYFIKLL